jgi:hypothetical protein
MLRWHIDHAAKGFHEGDWFIPLHFAADSLFSGFWHFHFRPGEQSIVC